MLVRESLTALAVASLLVACGGGGGGGSSTAPATGTAASSSSSSSAASSGASSVASSSAASSTVSSAASSVASSSTASSVSSSVSSSASSATSSAATSITSLGADGWASYGTNNLGVAGTTGGNGGKTYTVTNRNELIQALYGNAATINTDGSFSGTLDTSAKIIYVSGTISLNMNKALVEQTADNYVSASCANSTYGYATESALWTAYYAAYRPSVWGTAGSTPPSTVVSGSQESARACAAALQKKVVYISIPSNTSLIGLGSTAKIIHGDIVVGSSSSAPVDNVVIRNVAFEDSFDFFPQWDPTDSTSGRWNSAYDTVSVMYATHVWIDHCTFSDGARIDSNYPSVWNETVNGIDYGSAANDTLFHVQHHDGMSDITKIANYVTSSYNHYHDHDKSILLGGTDTASLTAENPSVLKVTFHHNYFQNLRQRQPRVRYGMVHLFNNYFSGDLAAANYAWAVAWVAGQGAKLYVENNVVDITGGTATASTVYQGSSSSSKVTSCAALSGMSTDYCTAFAFHSGNLLNGSALDVSTVSTTGVTTSSTPWPSAASPSATPSATPANYYSYTAGATTSLSTTVPANAGVGKL